MTISAQFRVDTRPYTGYRDPALPIGAWIAEAGIAGDASGGRVLMNFLFQPSEDDRVSQSYSLEQMAADATDELDRTAVIETIGMDALSPVRRASVQKWGFEMRGPTGFLGASTLMLQNLAGLPLWLGSPFPVTPSGEAGLRISFGNLNLILFAVTLQGYIWSARATLAEGGPQRPTGAFFGV